MVTKSKHKVWVICRRWATLFAAAVYLLVGSDSLDRRSPSEPLCGTSLLCFILLVGSLVGAHVSSHQ